MVKGPPKPVHQPLRVISRGRRNEVTSRPNVGIVQTTAMTMAKSDAHGDVSRFLAAVAVTAIVWVAGRPTGGALVVIVPPRPRPASGGRCRRRSGRRG